MHVAVVGLGSMGKRRLRIIRECFSDFTIFGVDGRDDRRDEVSHEYGVRTFESLDALFAAERVDAVFACASPLAHGDIAIQSLKAGCNVFCELNLNALWYEEAAELAASQHKAIFLSSTQMYQDDICWLGRYFADNTAGCGYEYHVGQYLPDWHPWEKPQDYFISQQKTNGCRELLAIELPWLDRVFSPITEIKSMSSSIAAGLNLGWPDTRILLVRHANGTVGTVTVDVVSRIPRRDLHVWGEWGDITWSGRAGTLRQSVSGGAWNDISIADNINSESTAESLKYKYAKIVNERAYVREVMDFVAILEGKPATVPPYSLADDLRVINEIDKIEMS